MGLIAAALDIVEGEETAYTCLLLTTIASLLPAFAAKTDADLKYCSPLLESIVQKLKVRSIITTFVCI